MAYGVDKALVIGGPDWLDQPLYDIAAHTTAVAATPYAQFPTPSMIQALLAARFGLLAHTETRELSVYALHVAAGGSKLSAAFPGPTPAPESKPTPPLMIVHKNVVLSTNTELKSLTSFLSSTLGRPVVDETHLTGRYDYAITGPVNAGTLPTALQDQLGLTLEPTTAPVQVVVVDSVQMPALDAQSTPGA